MRALVISDTHFGAWTGEDLLREQANLDLLEPHLDVDEVIVLGDMFDFLFGSLSDTFDAAAGLLGLLREKLQGKRLVCLAGNHDHHVVSAEGETRLELQLASPSQRPGQREVVELDPVYRLFEQRLEGVEVDLQVSDVRVWRRALHPRPLSGRARPTSGIWDGPAPGTGDLEDRRG